MTQAATRKQAISHRWIALMVINAHPKDADQLYADLPPNAAAYLSGPSSTPRTGIAVRRDAPAMITAINYALHHIVTDLLPNFGHTPVSAIEVFTIEDFRSRVLAAEKEEMASTSFCSVLLGPGRRLGGDALAWLGEE